MHTFGEPPCIVSTASIQTRTRFELSLVRNPKPNGLIRREALHDLRVVAGDDETWIGGETANTRETGEHLFRLVHDRKQDRNLEVLVVVHESEASTSQPLSVRTRTT